ncbi:MAG: beta-N-acetylhexosaminidase, partial [Butyrivibrio sp.]|nr:beta-N-acetylhexosaminidase [Butyrivibrio sp.]
TPCSLSSVVISDVLRSELGYEGIVITDELNQSAVTNYYTSAEACVKALEAGADMLYMPESFEEGYQGILDAVASGELTEDRINESLKRIYRIKYVDKLDE